MTKSPKKPEFAISVGVVGHRLNRLPKEGRSAVTVRVREALGHVLSAANSTLRQHEAFFSARNTAVTVISGLAEGADRIAAQVAIERSLQLTAILPFTIDAYEQDFREESSRAEYRTLINKAAKVVELCRSRRQKPQAYQAAGLTILDNSDVVLAVWDGRRSAGPGGTTELVELAAKKGLPIIYVDADGKQPTRLLWGGLAKFPIVGVDLSDLPVLCFAKSLPHVFDKVFRPSPGKSAHTRHNKLWRTLNVIFRLALGKREPTKVRDFFEERRRRWNFRLEFPSLLGVLGVRALKKRDLLPDPPESSSKAFRRLAEGAPIAFSDKTLASITRLSEAYGWADYLANRYAQMYRSAYVSNFMLVALSILAAAAPFLLGLPHVFSFAIGSACAAFLLINTFVGNFRNWHERSIEARELAERLRASLPIWLLAQHPRPLPGDEVSWVDWYVRAIYRALGVAPGCLNDQRLSDIKAVLVRLLDDQAQYHKTSAILMSRLEQRLFIVSTLILAIGLLLGYIWNDFELFAIVGITALTAALYGIRVTGDFEGRAERSRRAAAMLLEIRDVTQSEAVTLSNLRARAQAVYQMMMTEIIQWRLPTRSRPLAIPG